MMCFCTLPNSVIDREDSLPMITAELTAAGLQPLFVRVRRDHQFRSHVIGVLADARGVIAVAYRRGAYWSVTVRRPLPLAPAKTFNNRYFDTVRAYGYSGGTDVKGPVTSYHVDTPDGLRALASELCPVGARIEAHWEDAGLDSDYAGPECCSDPSAP